MARCSSARWLVSLLAHPLIACQLAGSAAHWLICSLACPLVACQLAGSLAALAWRLIARCSLACRRLCLVVGLSAYQLVNSLAGRLVACWLIGLLACWLGSLLLVSNAFAYSSAWSPARRLSGSLAVLRLVVSSVACLAAPWLVGGALARRQLLRSLSGSLACWWHFGSLSSSAYLLAQQLFGLFGLLLARQRFGLSPAHSLARQLSGGKRGGGTL